MAHPRPGPPLRLNPCLERGGGSFCFQKLAVGNNLGQFWGNFMVKTAGVVNTYSVKRACKQAFRVRGKLSEAGSNPVTSTTKSPEISGFLFLLGQLWVNYGIIDMSLFRGSSFDLAPRSLLLRHFFHFSSDDPARGVFFISFSRPA